MQIKTLGAMMAGLLLLAVPGMAQTASCDGETYNCFLLRTAAADAAMVMATHALLEVAEVKGGDPVVKLVTGPQATLPTTTLAGLGADPLVLGAELVEATAASEGSGSAAVETSAPHFQAALTSTGSYTGPEAAHFAAPLWNGYMQQPLVSQIKLDVAHADPRPEAMGLGVVAVIDTGVDPGHALLAGSLVPGYDFLTETAGFASEWSALDPATASQTESDLRDAAEQSYSTIIEGNGEALVEQSYSTIIEQSYSTIIEQSYSTIIEDKDLPGGFGHGTMVAGIIRLVAPGAQIMPLRVFDENGTGNLGDIIRAIYFAVDNGADVINMSFSVSSGSPELMAALAYASQNGVVMVSSVGNDNVAALTQPSMYPNVVGVASVDDQSRRSDFTNWGPMLVKLGAPGEGIVTAFPGDLYAAAWGTSFSSAVVAGTIALMHDDLGGGSYAAIDWMGAHLGLSQGSSFVTDWKLSWKVLDVNHAMNCGLSGGSC